MAELIDLAAEIADELVGGAINDAVADAAAALGGLTGLVHAAGRAHPEPVGAFTADSWDEVVDVNLRAHALLSQEMLPYLEEAAKGGESGSPSIVAISSIEGMAANPWVPAYCASKGGVINLTRQLAVDYGAQQHHRHMRRACYRTNPL